MSDRPESPAATTFDELRKGVGALVATTRCYKRPDSKLEPDPGPCGKCAACMARIAYYGAA